MSFIKVLLRDTHTYYTTTHSQTHIKSVHLGPNFKVELPKVHRVEDAVKRLLVSHHHLAQLLRIHPQYLSACVLETGQPVVPTVVTRIDLEGGREGGREKGREGGRKGGREGEREGGRKRGRGSREGGGRESK